MSILSNLYPPIVDTFMPAFVASDTNGCRIYFSLSSYNSLSSLNQDATQVTVRSQLTNLSALNSSKYPSEIMITTLYEDTSITNDYKYYIKITSEDMENNRFEIDQYYKIQIRFTESTVPTPTSMAIDSWLNTYLDKFSEWSSVCLIRGISEPTLTIKGFDTSYTELKWSMANTTFYGNLSFSDLNETETLKSYRIKIYPQDDLTILDYDSGILYNTSDNDKNSFSHNIKYNFEADGAYTAIVEYTTQNLYTNNIQFNFSVIQASALDLDIVMLGRKDPENGRIQIDIEKIMKTGETYTGDIVIRRTSSESDFKIWEDMDIRTFDKSTSFSYTWYDYTIESGVWYDYAVQAVDEDSNRGRMAKFMRPVMIELNDMFLTNYERQLKIKFNPNVSSLKKVYSDSKTDTLGSAYPYIRRNGASSYLQLSISGLISSEMDDNEIFTNAEELYGAAYEYQQQYNKDNNISSHADYIYEKKFRDKVMDFLYSDDAKLFRSPTEGNILVRIMDVSLSPEQTLGRRLYNFSATAYQIADSTVENYAEYGLINQEADE